MERVQPSHTPTWWRRFFARELPARWFALTMNLPTLLFLGAVLAYPIYFAGYISLHRVGIGQLRTGIYPFRGIDNYVRLFEDDTFWLTVKNTFYFTALVVPVELVLSVGIAILISQQDVWLSRLSRVLVLLPYAVPPIASGMIWEFVYNVNSGFLNRVLISLGIIDGAIAWAGNADTAIFAVAVAYIWRTVPFSILLVHAALQSIPRTTFEAAYVDGATVFRAFWHVTLPLLRPIIVVTLILRTTFAIMVFEEIMAITNGGPGNATWLASWYTYQKSFAPPFDVGLGAASAYVLAIFIAIFAVLYVKFIYRRITY